MGVGEYLGDGKFLSSRGKDDVLMRTDNSMSKKSGFRTRQRLGLRPGHRSVLDRVSETSLVSDL